MGGGAERPRPPGESVAYAVEYGPDRRKAIYDKVVSIEKQECYGVNVGAESERRHTGNDVLCLVSQSLRSDLHAGYGSDSKTVDP